MKDYIVYHNPDRMGGPVTSVDPWKIVTNKSVTDEIIGSRVWLITGEGRPRTYYLCSWFFVDEVTSGRQHGFKTQLKGNNYRTFLPMINLSDHVWFSDFRQALINFRGGLQSITSPDFVSKLEELSESFPK